jgi:monoamine oxidase
MYDVIIVGGGVAGLRIGIELRRRQQTCCILEHYPHPGGRIHTYHTSLPGRGPVAWEAGAGRIAVTHHKVRALMKRYGLDWVPIHSTTIYLERHSDAIVNRFSSLHDVFIEPLRSLPVHVLQTHTLAQISEQVFGKERTQSFYEQFPYFSEIHTLRADHGIYVFDYEMKSMEGFGSCKGGLSLIIKGMVEEYISLGGIIECNRTVVSVQKGMRVRCADDSCYDAHKCVLALPSEAIKRIRGASHLPILNKIVMNPLLRMYAVFPVHHGRSWFSDLPHVVTNDALRFIIPMDDSRGIIMISYTDGDDARTWMKMSPRMLRVRVMQHIRALFPHRSIPDPLFFKTHTWKEGCSYWKPGHYDIFQESKASLQPLPKEMPGLFLCSESFAVLQCWIECAIEQADHLLALPSFCPPKSSS